MKSAANKFIWLALGLAGVVFTLRVRAELTEVEARARLAQGAKVVDVRTVPEFTTKSLTNVINLPLDELKKQFPARFPNKSEVILLHCRTGRRSGIAEKELRELGYTNVFNIGSYDKAERIVRDGRRP